MNAYYTQVITVIKIRFESEDRDELLIKKKIE